MKKRRLRDIEVSEVGMGCMAFSHGYGQIPDETPVQGIITEFDIKTWHSLVEYATVMPNKTIIFHFRNGNEESVRLEEAQ